MNNSNPSVVSKKAQSTEIHSNRYRFYRFHKWISFALSELERLIAKSDFSVKIEVEKIKIQLTSLEECMMFHAASEDKSIGTLLRNKGSSLHEKIEQEHKHHHQQYTEFKKNLDDILATTDAREQEHLGHEFYLNYRLFVSENLQHLHQEETIIMSELQKLYSDKELQLVKFKMFSHMTPEQMAHTIAMLEPHINPTERKFYINEMRMAEPEKFKLAGII